MCGIAGYYLRNGDSPRGEETLRVMCNAMAHRGPDGDGYLVDPPFGMGMRRLSIIDLVSGDQPISNETDDCHVILNGEIYNYQDLRKKLVRLGHEFKTDSDTETIIHLYEEQGIDCVEKLNGQFALVIWDQRKRTLCLARDRLGIKPVYYYWDGRTFVFASEIKAIAASELVDLQINPQALWDYLTFRYVPQSESIWQHMHKLPPGHSLTLHANSEPVVEQYWDIAYSDDFPNKSETEYYREFEDLFLDAVRLRLIADVPVGVLLSGGLDSSSVAAAIKEVHNARLDSFSVAFENSQAINELPFARQVAEFAGTDHHEVVIGKQDFIDFLPRFVHSTDEPLADLAAIPLYYVSKLARERVKVVLSGEGSDEILGGYHFDQTQRMWDILRRAQIIPRPLWGAAFNLSGNVLSNRWKEKLKWLSLPESRWLKETPFNMTHFLTAAEQAALFHGRADFASSFEKVMADTQRATTDIPLHQALYTYCQSWLVEDLLMKADKMTMATSVELRVPFLDHRLVTWAAQSAPWIKVKKDGNGKYVSKWVLRKFAQDRLPQTIIERPKQGFPVPVYSWLANEIKDWAWDTLSGDARIYSWLDRDVVHGYLERGTQKGVESSARHQLWHLLILELWLQAWQSG